MLDLSDLLEKGIDTQIAHASIETDDGVIVHAATLVAIDGEPVVGEAYVFLSTESASTAIDMCGAAINLWPFSLYPEAFH